MQRNNPNFISNHEDLEVYKIAFDAAMEIFELSQDFPKKVCGQMPIFGRRFRKKTL
ncbi:MAG: four helix bundle protein [Xenococcaceae cyanobacterium MO_167.B27]|nr:four helix bundle protein [Xenococcaceae cyanobacterium MO_167.B27]